MKYKRISLEVEAEPYEIGKGLEDGYEAWVDIVVHGWIPTENLVKITRPNGKIVCPYIETKRGRLFISKDDYIITDSDGSRHLCSKNSFFIRYNPC